MKPVPHAGDPGDRPSVPAGGPATAEPPLADSTGSGGSGEAVDSEAPPAAAAGAPGGRPGRIARRAFLGATGAVVGAAVVAPHVAPQVARLTRPRRVASQIKRLAPQSPEVEAILGSPSLQPGWSYFLQVERDVDLAVMDFIFYGFTVGTNPRNGDPALLPDPDGQDHVLLVRFPPQSIAEGEYLYSDAVGAPGNGNVTGLPIDPPPILSAMSGPSQLAFVFNSDLHELVSFPTGTMQDLLDWSSFRLSVPANAQIFLFREGAYAEPGPPGPFDTFIEFPYAMYLSPTQWQGAGADIQGFGYATVFENNVQPLTTNGYTDLYRTSVVSRPIVTIPNPGEFFTPNEIDQPIPFAALWCDDLTAAGYSSYPFFGITYNPQYDVTLWQYINYGVPST